VTVETSLSNYQQVEGLQLPAQSRTQVDGRTILELQLDRYTINGDGTDLAAPAEAVSARPPAPDPPKVEVVEVAAGVWLLAGQSHHSAVVEFDDHLMLIEAPQGEARTQAVIAAARELAPSKPLTELVVSHHHFDHTAGLRAAIAEGLTVITHARNAAFVEEMARRSHSRRPDLLEKNPRPVSVRTVSDALTLRDGAMEVQLYEISGNPHAETLLMAYLPRQRLLIEADAYSPGGSYHPYAANLLQNIEKRQLAVDRIVPLHGTVVTLAELRKDVAAQ
jgi:glyoxylase-like metal-dependent hydrolase (beta-lactamase superfamily II)